MYLHTMLIGPRAEDCLLASKNLPSFEDIGKDHRIEVSDMRGYIRVSR